MKIRKKLFGAFALVPTWLAMSDTKRNKNVDVASHVGAKEAPVMEKERPATKMGKPETKFRRPEMEKGRPETKVLRPETKKGRPGITFPVFPFPFRKPVTKIPAFPFSSLASQTKIRKVKNSSKPAPRAAPFPCHGPISLPLWQRQERRGD